MKYLLILLCLGFNVALSAQNVTSIQEAMANYDYKTAIRLIDGETASSQLLLQKAKALKGLGHTAEALSTLQHIISGLPENQQAMLERRLGINSFPTYMIMDKTGKIVDMNPPSPKQTRQLIDELSN